MNESGMETRPTMNMQATKEVIQNGKDGWEDKTEPGSG